MLWYKFGLAFFYCVNGWAGQWFHFYKPLFGNSRLYRCTAAVTSSYIVVVVLHFYQSTFCFQICYDGFSCLIAVHTGIFFIFIYDLSIFCQHIKNRQVVAQTYFKVVRVVGRCNLYNTGSKFHIYILICDQRNLSVYQWKDQHLSYQVFVSFIVWIYCYGSISQQSLRTGCGQIDIAAAICKWVAQMPEMSLLVFVLYLCIGNGCKAVRAPVDNTLATVDQAFVVKIYKHFFYCFVATFIHGKTLSVPVTG